jgi:STE24 endopeptidase
MDADRIEAVFGHEAGHVRQRHIQYFLLFTISGLLLVMGFMELLICLGARATSPFALNDTTIELLGFVAVLAVWGIGFGWVSRRFERQADLYGVRCITRSSRTCAKPCGLHPGTGEPAVSGTVCATAATVFASALDRVAVLNGIPHEERSWRHSSIASRIRFLATLVGDAARPAQYDRLIRRIKVTLWVTSVGGSALAGWYIQRQPEYRRDFEYNFVRPFTSREQQRPVYGSEAIADDRLGV